MVERNGVQKVLVTSARKTAARPTGDAATSKRKQLELNLAQLPAGLYASPSLSAAPVLDLMCSQFVLQLVALQGNQFNLRRDLNGVLALIGRHLVWPEHVLHKVRAFLARRCAENPYWLGQEQLTAPDFLERYGLWRGAYEEGTLFFYLDEFAKDYPKEILSLLTTTHDILRRSITWGRTLVERNLATLGNLLDLNTAERAVLLYGTLARHQRDLRSLLVEFKVSSAAEAYAQLATVAAVPAAQLAQAMASGGRLERMGLLENLIAEHSITDLADVMKVSDKLPAVLMRKYQTPRELMAVFTRPAAESTLQPAQFDFVGEDLRLLTQLLQNAVAQGAQGVNVLLYGAPGTGKTELAKVLAKAAGLTLYEVEYADADGDALSGRERYRSLQMAQAFLKSTAQAALLFDEVEDVFPPLSVDAAQLMSRQEQMAFGQSVGHSMNSSVQGKAWVNQVLETNPVPTIWVTNSIAQIDPAFRRRFAYHLELSTPPPGARAQMVRSALAQAPVSEDFVAKLTQRKQITPAQIHTALRFAQMVGADAAQELELLMERQLQHADLALGRKTAKEEARPSVTHYDLAMLHTESKYPIDRIVQALAARGHGTLCFYGPPGTGKTALAEHIAQQLGKPLMVKKASDLMSKFVGETEQNLAAMFKEAEHEEAVLLLDEADSFLQDRRHAERNYEVTEVNEMLQGMECHRGIFICTTNLLERIDQAALRRFAFKIQFKPLSSMQRERMFVIEALGGDAALLEPAQGKRLAALEQLCPGDFAAVKRQADILGETLSAEDFLTQLEAEHRIKPQVREQRSVGFV